MVLLSSVDRPTFVGAHGPRIVEKGWGREIIFADTEDYAGKILEIRPLGRMSMHFHVEKHETWYCLSGYIEVRYYDTFKGSEHTRDLKPGDCWTNPQGFPHQVFNHSPELAVIVEASTRDQSADNYRIAPGDSQRPELGET